MTAPALRLAPTANGGVPAQLEQQIRQELSRIAARRAELVTEFRRLGDLELRLSAALLGLGVDTVTAPPADPRG